MANVRELRARINSVKNTQQITKAMKMVAAAKLRRIEGSMPGIRTFAGYCQFVLDELLAGDSMYTDQFLVPRKEVRRVCYVLFVGSRGLCGMYNHNVLHYLRDLLSQEQREAFVVVCGRWGSDVIAQNGVPVRETFTDLSDTPTMNDALTVSEYLKRLYLSGDADEIHLVYQHYQSALQQVPCSQQLLPAAAETKRETPRGYLFEPDAEAVLENVMRLYINNTVLSAMLEAKVGEHAARMTAMSTATDATTELIGTLSLKMNRIRQAAITTEIAEIVGGANALKKKEK